MVHMDNEEYARMKEEYENAVYQGRREAEEARRETQ
jgi:hypothetical protein